MDELKRTPIRKDVEYISGGKMNPWVYILRDNSIYHVLYNSEDGDPGEMIYSSSNLESAYNVAVKMI